MSNIPYFFDTPVPRYFRDNGWMKNPNMAAFITWCFSRCNTRKHMIYHIQKAIELEPFEFIFGRRVCSEETGLTEREIRTLIGQLNSTPNGEILKKSTSKSTNKYTVYKWVLTHFIKIIDQQIDQQTTSRRPADDHKLEDKQEKKDLSCFVSACAREKKEEEGKIIAMPEIVTFKSRKHPSIISIRITELYADLLAKGYADTEIDAALKTAKEKDPVLSGPIENYIEGVIKNQRKEKHAKPKNNASRATKRNNNFNDSVERSRKTLSVASVSWERS